MQVLQKKVDKATSGGSWWILWGSMENIQLLWAIYIIYPAFFFLMGIKIRDLSNE